MAHLRDTVVDSGVIVDAFNRALENQHDVIPTFTHRRCSGYGQMMHNLG